MRTTAGGTSALSLIFVCLLLLGLSTAISAEEAKPGRPADGVYAEIAGVREFAGRLIVRPIQHADWISVGLTLEEAEQRVDLAKTIVESTPVLDYVSQTDEYIVGVPSGETENTVSRVLLATGLFQYAEPDWILYPIGDPNDPRFGNQ